MFDDEVSAPPKEYGIQLKPLTTELGDARP